MKSLKVQQQVVRDSRAQFEKTFSEISSRTQFPAIVHETLSILNLRGKGSPLLVAGVAAASAWVIGKLIRRRKSHSLGTKQTTSYKKGELT